MPQVKKLKEIGGTLMEKEIPELNSIDTSLRPMNESHVTSDHNGN